MSSVHTALVVPRFHRVPQLGNTVPLLASKVMANRPRASTARLKDTVSRLQVSMVRSKVTANLLLANKERQVGTDNNPHKAMASLRQASTVGLRVDTGSRHSKVTELRVVREAMGSNLLHHLATKRRLCSSILCTTRLRGVFSLPL